MLYNPFALKVIEYSHIEDRVSPVFSTTEESNAYWVEIKDKSSEAYQDAYTFGQSEEWKEYTKGQIAELEESLEQNSNNMNATEIEETNRKLLDLIIELRYEENYHWNFGH